ncbi:MAG: PilZ domain-containing protein [Candidatus Sulfotelmatobacter sp.]
MRRLAAVLCQDASALQTLKSALSEVGITHVPCRSHQEAMELVLGGRCAALVVDFDLPGAAEIMKTASLLLPPQRPLLVAMSGEWAGTGQAFQSGVSRILYKPLQLEQVRDAFEPGRASKKKGPHRAPRYGLRSLIYLDLENGAVPAIGINISEQGMAIRTAEPIAARPDVAFRCILPGTREVLHGHADVIWADAQGRAGMFFSRLSPAAHKDLKTWLRKHGRNNADAARSLLPPADTAVFAASRS